MVQKILRKTRLLWMLIFVLLLTVAFVGIYNVIKLQKERNALDVSLQKPLTVSRDFTGNVWLISYADGPEVYFANQNALAYSAINKGVDFICMYQRKHISPDFYQEHRAIFEQSRGVGYWLWKPYLLLKTLELAPEGDVIVYIDSGAYVKSDITPLLNYTKANDKVLVENHHLNRGFIKRDAVELLNMGDNVLEQPQLDASIIILKNTESSREFVKKWLLLCQDPRLLTDTPSAIKEYPDFHDHRHDQALLSLLYLKDNLNTHIIPFSEKQTYFNAHRRRPNQAQQSLFK